MKITKKENQKKVVYNFAIISYQKEDENRVILKRLTIPLACTPIESYEEFCAVVESIEKQYNQKYGDATVLIALPMDFFRFIQRCDWLKQTAENEKRHIVVSITVKNKADTSFVWQIFNTGYGSREVEASIKDFWQSANGLKKVKDEMRNRGYQDSDNLYVDNVRIFDSTGNEGWDDTNVLLFEKEQEFLNKDTYMNFYQEIPKSVFNSGPVADKK